MGTFQNVLETFPLYDTVCIQSDLSTLSVRPQGWYANFVALGQAIDIPFFNQRNVASAGLEYCNLETRDQSPWAFSLKRLNVHFFAPVVSQRQTGPQNVIESLQSALWEADIPRHYGLELAINQDVRLEIAAMMPGSGGGPVAGGYGGLGAEGMKTSTHPYAHNSGSQGIADRRNGFVFPISLDIPRKAAISVTLKPSEYCRRLLQSLQGPHNYQLPTADGSTTALYSAVFGIRVTLFGIREVQQRGEAHA